MDLELFPANLGTTAFLLISSFVLSGVIGVEREIRLKSAGAKTHILVGMGSALFTLVSSYGFAHVLGDVVILDPSRIAAQIVTGIGFLGAGVIFVRRNIISGLTTAASVWVTAAVGMACGAGMPVLAALTVALYLFAVTAVAWVVKHLPDRNRTEMYRVRYSDGEGVLRKILQLASDQGYEAVLSRTKRFRSDGEPVVDVVMEFTHGKQRPAETLFQQLSEVDGVLEVMTEQRDHD